VTEDGLDLLSLQTESRPTFCLGNAFSCLGNSDIRVEVDIAHSETYCTAHHVMHPDEKGVTKNSVVELRYVDRFERHDDAWLISRRTCIYDLAYIVAPDESWPLDPPYITGTQDLEDPSYVLLGTSVRSGK
jgi:hypothetical protein